jgi:chromate reductase, NAD(P)H dehydrogenase (quinone)
MKERTMKILAISGSIRNGSSNATLLGAAILLAPAGMEISLYGGMAELPHYNPDIDDLDRGIAPPSVLDFRARLKACDGVLISSPEYAHGIPGVMKNSLDWLVGSGELVGKPLALLNASPRSVHAQAALLEVLRTIGANIIDDASLAFPLTGKKLNEAGIVADPELSGLLNQSLSAFVRAIASQEEAVA